MIHVDRLPEPDILRRSREQWLRNYLERRADDPQTRPSSRQYAHADIRNTLEAMSHCKCFYCETKVGPHQTEVDHYIEVAEAPERAFDWENLYLSCPGCNSKKLSNQHIPVVNCLDPCGNENPAAHLAFEDEIITTKAGSPIGSETIKKYRLDRPELNYLRVKALQRFEKNLRQLRERRADRPLTDPEKEIIRRYKQPDHPFSLMFQVYLADVAP